MKKWKAVLIGIGTTAGMSIILQGLAAWIIARTGTYPAGLIPLITTVIACISAFCGGFFSSAYRKENGILLGLLSSIVLLAVLIPLSLFVFQNEFGAAGAGKTAAILLSGAVGGILGVNQKSRVKF